MMMSGDVAAPGVGQEGAQLAAVIENHTILEMDREHLPLICHCLLGDHVGQAGSRQVLLPSSLKSPPGQKLTESPA